MLFPTVIAFITTVSFTNSAEVKFGSQTRNGHWNTVHRISFTFVVGGKRYFFGLTDYDWFIQELTDYGGMGSRTSKGTFNSYYTKAFHFDVGNKQFIFAMSLNNNWIIRQILPDGKMGGQTDHGPWDSQPTIMFPYSLGGEHYLFSLTDRDWFITELLPNGIMGLEKDRGRWHNDYTLGFPFSINGRQYFYCLSEKYWFIQELLPNGKMGVETNNGHWLTKHILYVPFSVDNNHYFYGLTDISGKRKWLIQELLPGGKMGEEKKTGNWHFYYNISFTFTINGRVYMYLLSESYWIIYKVIQEPQFPFVNTERDKYCTKNERLEGHDGNRYKRQNNGTCSVGCEGLNAVESYVTSVENDDDNYITTTYNNPSRPLMSVSTFRVFADQNHESYIDLTAAMRAEIHYSHMAPRRDPIITTEVREHLQQMDRENDDEAGHLLASSLGGPGVEFNFAPQSPMLNRAVSVPGSILPQPGWYDVEELLRDFLIETGGYIRWSLAPQYLQLPDSRRPTGFLLSVRFYDEQGDLMNFRNEGAVRSYNFVNVPRAACANPNHVWWNGNH